MNEERGYRGGIGPVVLILLGLIFLANNFGLLPWGVWGMLWRFWPLILIMWGLQIIFGRTSWARFIVTLISLLVAIGVLVVVAAASNERVNSWMSDHMPFWQTKQLFLAGSPVTLNQTIAQSSYSNLVNRKVTVDVSAAKLSISDNDTTDYAKLSGSYPKNLAEPKLTHSASNQELSIGLNTQHMPMMWLGSKEVIYDLALGVPELSTDFDVDLGAGQANFDLKNLKVGQTKVNVGAGSATLTFTKASAPSKLVDLSVGAGSITVRIPKEMALKVDHQIGLGSASVDQTTLKGDDSYQTPDYDSATVKLALKINVGTGSVKIERQ